MRRMIGHFVISIVCQCSIISTAITIVGHNLDFINISAIHLYQLLHVSFRCDRLRFSFPLSIHNGPFGNSCHDSFSILVAIHSSGGWRRINRGRRHHLGNLWGLLALLGKTFWFHFYTPFHLLCCCHYLHYCHRYFHRQYFRDEIDPKK